MNHWHNYPFVRIAIPFILGILVSVQFAIRVPDKILILLFLFSLFFTYFRGFRTYKFRNVYGVFIFLFFLAFGAAMSYECLQKPQLPASDVLIAIVQEAPEEKENSVKLIVKTETFVVEDSLQHFAVKALLYFQKDSLSKNLVTGDEILIFQKLDTVQTAMNPYAFDFKRYLKFKQIHFQAYVKSGNWMLLEKQKVRSLKAFAGDIREVLIEKLKNVGFSESELGVASAILLGYDQILDPETRDEFSDAGAMHVLCVSGLHVGIIYLIFASLLNPLKRKKYGIYLRGILLLMVIWLYAFITGLSPSVLRASTMISFIVLGESLKRSSNIYNSIAASAFFLLLINPLMLMEVGFQLSYSAVLAIVSVFPVLSKRIYIRNKLFAKIRDILIVSLAAQLGTFPLAIYYFHQFPVYFLFTNLFVVSFAAIIIYLGFAYLLLFGISLVNSFLAFLLKFSIRLLNLFVGFIDSLPGASLEGLVLGLLAVFLVYFLIYAGFKSFLLKNKAWFFCLLVSLLALLLLNTYRISRIYQTDKLTVYSTSKGLAMDFISSGENRLFLDTLVSEKQLSFAAQNHWIHAGIKQPTKIFLDTVLSPFMLEYQGKKILCFNGRTASKVLEIDSEMDYVFLSSNPGIDLNAVDSLYHPQEIVIARNNYFYRQNKWEKTASEKNILLWPVRKKGTFEINF